MASFFSSNFGLFFILSVYCFWLGLYGREKKEEEESGALGGLVTAGFVYLLILPLVWTVMSSRNEIIHNYDYGKDTAAWITENNLQDYAWLSAWQPVDLTYSSYNISLTTSAYLGKSINYNLHHGLSYCVRDTGDYEAALKEAKELVDAIPKTIKEKVSRDEADAIAAKLQEVGAKVEIK